MASSGLGKGLGTLLAESAQQPVRTLSEPERFKNGSHLLVSAAPAELTPTAKSSEQVVDNKWISNRGFLVIADLSLQGIGAWLIFASPMAYSKAASTVGALLVIIGCFLACLAFLPQRPSQ
jgi:hypothetical protein